MARSLFKGPCVSASLLKKVLRMQSGDTPVMPIKCWERSAHILPSFVGLTFNVHNGKKFVPVFVTEYMVGHRLGEFSPTRVDANHPKSKKGG